MILRAAFAALMLLSRGAFAEDVERIAVISAFEPEWLVLQENLTDRDEVQLNGTTFVTGKIAEKDVVLFLSGVSIVNASMTTQMALDRFNIDAIVFSGIAGGVDPALNIGDVVVPQQWAQYLEAVFARETDEGFAPPAFLETPFPNFGMIFPRDVDLARPGGQVDTQFWFPVDAQLFAVAQQVSQTIDLEKCATGANCLSVAPKVHVGGNGVSGQVFMDNAAFREYTFQTFKARVVDMESAAVAHVAAVNGVPFIAFRSLSDLAGGGEARNEMATFMSLASLNSATVVTEFLAALP